MERRTLELQRANHSLQEVAECRAEQLQTAVQHRRDGDVGRQPGPVLRAGAWRGRAPADARNFYIALVNGAGSGLDFRLLVDEHNASRATPFSRGLTEYVVRNRRPLLASRQQIDALLASGEVRESGARSHCWLACAAAR